MSQTTSPFITPREFGIATSGFATFTDTIEAGNALRPALLAAYPKSNSPEAWAQARSEGILGAASLDGLPASVSAFTKTFGGVECVVIEPKNMAAAGTYLHFHGGGWSLGSPFSSAATLAQLVQATGLRAVSVGYRLAPEHQGEEIVGDCLNAARAVVSEKPGEFLAIGGESSGAHLAAITLTRLRDEGSTPFSTAILTYGFFDLGGAPGLLANARGQSVLRQSQTFAGTTDATRLRDGKISPLFASLTGMPPARFMCGTRDGLLEDTLLMEARWKIVAETELDVIAGAEHAFTLIPSSTTQDALGREAAYLRRALATYAAENRNG